MTGPMDLFIFLLFVSVGAVFVYLGTRARCMEPGPQILEDPTTLRPDRMETKCNWKLHTKRSSQMFALAGIFTFCAATVLYGAVLVGLTVAAVTLSVVAVLFTNGYRNR